MITVRFAVILTFIMKIDVQALPCEPWKDFAVCHLGKYPAFWGYRLGQSGELIWTDASIVGEEFNEPNVTVERLSAIHQSPSPFVPPWSSSTNGKDNCSSPLPVGAASSMPSVAVAQHMPVLLPTNVNVDPSPPVLRRGSGSPVAMPLQSAGQYTVQELEPTSVHRPYVATPAQHTFPSFSVMSSSHTPPGQQCTPGVFLPSRVTILETNPASSFSSALPLMSTPAVQVASPQPSHSHHNTVHQVSNGSVPNPAVNEESMYLARHKTLQEIEKTRQLELEFELDRIEKRSKCRVRNVGALASPQPATMTSSRLSLPSGPSPASSFASLAMYGNAEATAEARYQGGRDV